MGRVLASGEEFGGGRYVVEACIGAGNMGVVYRVQDTALGTSRALKVIGSETGVPELNRRFLRECLAMVRVSEHPHVVSIVDRGDRPDGSPYLVMEYIAGETLDEVLDSHTGDMAWMVQALRGIARALDRAHALGVVHRDVKPSNIIVGPGDHLYLTDFGIAHLSDASKLTQTFMPKTLAMQPRAASRPGHQRTSDQFSLALVAFELVAGHLPYAAPADRLDGLSRSSMAEIPGSADRLWAAFERALRPEPTSRWPSCEAFIDALSAAQVEATVPRLKLVGNVSPPATVVRPAILQAPTPGPRITAPAMIMQGGKDVLVPGENPPQLSWLLGRRRAVAVCDRLRYGISIGTPFSVEESGDAVTNEGAVVTRLSRNQWWPGVITDDGYPDFDLPQPALTRAAPDGFRGTIDQVAHHHWGVQAGCVPKGPASPTRDGTSPDPPNPLPEMQRPLADLDLPKKGRCSIGIATSARAVGKASLPRSLSKATDTGRLGTRSEPDGVPQPSGPRHLSVVAVNPRRPAAWIWSRIRASSGETIRVGPEPRSRISRVAMK